MSSHDLYPNKLIVSGPQLSIQVAGRNIGAAFISDAVAVLSHMEHVKEVFVSSEDPQVIVVCFTEESDYLVSPLRRDVCHVLNQLIQRENLAATKAVLTEDQSNRSKS